MEAEEIVIDGLEVTMDLKGLPSNFKLFTTVITQKIKENLLFSEFKYA